MKLIQLTCSKPIYHQKSVVVEVPDEYPEEDVETLLTEEHIATLKETWTEYNPGEEIRFHDVEEITEEDGSPHFRLVDGKLVPAE